MMRLKALVVVDNGGQGGGRWLGEAEIMGTIVVAIVIGQPLVLGGGLGGASQWQTAVGLVGSGRKQQGATVVELPEQTRKRRRGDAWGQEWGRSPFLCYFKWFSTWAFCPLSNLKVARKIEISPHMIKISSQTQVKWGVKE